MSELFWAELAIPRGNTPDWAAAHAYLDRVAAEQICEDCPEYANDISDAVLEQAGVARPAWGFEPEDILAEPQLAAPIRQLLHRDLARVAELLAASRALTCRFEVVGINVYVYCSGFGEPDRICNAWLCLDNLGVFQHAGFLTTTVVDGLPTHR